MHAGDVGRPVVDLGGGHQLAALGHAGDQHRVQVGAGGVDGGGVAGGAGAEDQDLGVWVGGGSYAWAIQLGSRPAIDNTVVRDIVRAHRAAGRKPCNGARGCLHSGESTGDFVIVPKNRVDGSKRQAGFDDVDACPTWI
jgi:hypothetical protein